MISSMIKKFDMDANILYGNIDLIKDTPFGYLTLELTGAPDQVAEGLDYLSGHGLQVERSIMFDFGANAWMVDKVLIATWETIYMVAISTFLSYVVGLPLGIILVTTSEGHILENKRFNQVLGSIVNAVRSIPFIIFLILIHTLTRRSWEHRSALLHLLFPLHWRQYPCCPPGRDIFERDRMGASLEAALSMGANAWQVISKVLLPEAMPSLIWELP